MSTNKILVALLHEHFDAAHLDEVKADMITMGAPTIRVAWSPCGCWAALEGCHRLRAAEALGLTPTIVPIEYDDDTTAEDAGFSDDDFPDDRLDLISISSIAGRAYRMHMIEFDEPVDD